jgi:hypothetical protein
MVDLALTGGIGAPPQGPPLWDGRAGERIAAILAERLGLTVSVPPARA